MDKQEQDCQSTGEEREKVMIYGKTGMQNLQKGHNPGKYLP